MVLEELIAGMQAEYGVPATPQEYRLLIRVPTSEDAGAAATSEPEEEIPSAREETGSRTAPPRRRRRGRRRTDVEPGAAGEDGAGETAAP